MRTDNLPAGEINLQSRNRFVAASVAFTLIFVLLFQYRIASFFNKLGANITPLGSKFPVAFDYTTTSAWFHPFFFTLEYLNDVWFNTLLGLLIAGAVAAFLPNFAQRYLRGNSFGRHLAGVAFGLPNMLCSCCAACALPGLRKAGAGLGPIVSFFITAPALNIVTIILAFELLPWPLAVARLLLGVGAAIGIPYAVTRLCPEVTEAHFEPHQQGSSHRTQAAESSVTSLFYSWMQHTWHAATFVLPMLVLGIFFIGIIKTVTPFSVIAQYGSSGWMPTFLASVVGTILMVPTFTEVLWVKELTQHGLGMGPAAALLITLPAASLPSLWVLGRVCRSYRVALLLGFFIFLLGFVAGIILGAI